MGKLLFHVHHPAEVLLDLPAHVVDVAGLLLGTDSRYFFRKKYYYEVFSKVDGAFCNFILREVDPRVEAPDVAAVDLAQEDVLKPRGGVCNKLKKIYI